MNTFEKKLMEIGEYPLRARRINTLQVNLGYQCNLSCSHCHVEASPDREEIMSLTVISKILDILRSNNELETVDITGGSPELNIYYKYFVKSCSMQQISVIVRSNLAVLTRAETRDIPEFLADNGIKIVASLPCYSEDGVDGQRGKGTYEKAISVFQRLNKLGYGADGSGLEIDIMFNPAGAEIAPDEPTLENAYREKLFEMHGIVFNRLTALGNMPIGRLGAAMTDEEKRIYLKELEEQFNTSTVKNLMCRSMISVSPEGILYDCDFWQVLHLPVKSRSRDISVFDYQELSSREIVTNNLCLLCTAGAGASCRGALVKETKERAGKNSSKP
jgi:radical SAM/Cys-rich protein